MLCTLQFYFFATCFVVSQKVHFLRKVTIIYGGENAMFQVRQTEEMINKTFRLPQSLLDELAKVAEHEKVSVNNLVRQCCEYALSNMKAEK